MTPDTETLLAEARLYAARIFREHDWRVRELVEGRWDHHPMIADYLADPERLREQIPAVLRALAGRVE